ncbi:Por secretion system C-terminal sorting domain-containing protein [Reichenbachiella faecimaris]|uniref:Por secretion system C-terminal sorting domain-containing protein n=1 Tax=Reichenbachiella faecimaris TaxID=692418 RepID=A0A1W2G836_REIFA|nr:Ig-like domain-containing protein [Reichenbachiella faecimaris]SMD32771.1 Por secretion system C-terminal sorting domain-containing protein [Reichenbachiella faecimaris]
MKNECLQKWRRSVTSIFGLVSLVLMTYNTFAQGDGLPRGAYQMPYTRYESDDTNQSQAQARTDYEFLPDVAAAEASGQHYLALSSDGDYVQWTVNEFADGVTLRFTIPDNASGLGNQGDLNVYVNGSLDQTITLNSYWAFHYLNKFQGAQGGNVPNAGFTEVRMYFDDINFKLNTPLSPGSSIRLEKTGGNGFEYGIDFIEIEQIEPVKGAPANSLSVTDAPYNANGNDTIDDLAAFHACLADANAQGKNMYIPAGKYYLDGQFRLNASNITVQGAGIWHTELFFSSDLAFSGGVKARADNLEFSDVHVTTNNNDRFCPDNERIPGWNEPYKGYKGIFGTWGSNSVVKDVWVEHFETGMWFADYDFAVEGAPQDITEYLLITNARIRNNYADGVNFAEGSNHCTVEHTNIRNSGDDGFAVWSSDNWGHGIPGTHNTLQFSTVENVWRAGGVAFHGADGHGVNHVLIRDGRGCAGIRFTDTFPGFKFLQNNQSVMSNITIINHGTTYDLFNEEIGAIYLSGAVGLWNVYWEDIDIIDSQRHAITLEGGPYQNIEFHSLKVDGTGLDPYDHNTVVFTDGGTGIAASASGQIDLYNPQWISWETQDSIITTGNLVVNTFFTEPIGVISVDMPDGPLDMVIGEITSLTPTFVPQNASNKTVAYTNSNPSVGTLNEITGAFEATGVGQTVITVTTDDGNHTDQVTINVSAAVNIEATDAAAAEAGDTGTFTISISDVAQSISVGYTISGSATSGSDYTSTPALSGSVTLSPGNLTQVITVSPIDDSEFEGVETLTLTLQPGSGYQLGGTTAATISISDNENPPCLGSVIGLTASAPANDTNIEASWSEVPVSSISNTNVGSVQGDYSGQWRAMYDNQALYVLVEVQDTDLNNDSGSEWWNDDVVNVFIDGNNSKGSSYDGLNDFQLGFRWNDANVNLGGNSVQNASGISFNMFATAGGYALKAAIPWSTIGVSPTLGNQIGFDIAVDDDDNGGTREAQTSSFATTEMGWAQPVLFGSVYLTTCEAIIPTTPIITSPLSITRKDGEAINYTITASNFPESFSATGLPQGITLNTSTGQLNGTLSVVETVSASITASNSAGSDTETLEIIVNPEPATGVTLSEAAVNLTIPNTHQLTATVLPTTATNQNVTWSSDDAAATVDANGLVTAVSSGTATITATTVDGGYTATTVFTVIAPGEQPPVSNPGMGQSISLPTNSTTLDGSGSYDPDGTIVTYLWVQVSGPGTATLSGQNTSTLAASNLIEGLYIFELTVTDDNNISDAETVSVNVIPESVFPADRGYYDAPYTRYESESGSIGGGAAVNGPTYDMALLASEATDRKFVNLPSNGSYVEWTVSGTSQDGLTLRYSIPDNASGTLALYVNGSKVQDIALSSYWSWQYFDVSPSTQGVPSNTNNGPTYEARMRFDELHFQLSNAVNAGDVIRLQKETNDGVAYGVDFIELETVPAPISAPTGYLNIMDYGATPNDQTNDALAIRNALDIANGDPSIQGIYIPAGRFINGQGSGSPTGNLWVGNDGLAIQGAGMWHTELYFSSTGQNGAGFLFDANNIQLSDIYLNSATNTRTPGNKAINGSLGSNSTINNVWAEHFETGFWISSMNNGGWNVTDGLVISNCRIRNVYADGVNLAKGTSNTTVEHTSFRNCIDDAMATWSVNFLEAVPPTACHGNVFRYSTVENNLRAAGLGFFGGHSHEAHHLLIKDNFAGPGIRLNTQFPAFPFGSNASETINIHDVTVIGCGTTKNIWTYRFGAVELELPTPTQGTAYDLRFVNFSDIDIIDSQHDAVFVHSYMASQNNNVIDEIYFNNVNINGTGVALDVNNGPLYPTAEGESGGHGIYVANFSSNNTFDGWMELSGSTFANIAGEDVAFFNNNGDFEVRFGETAAVTGVTVSPTTLSLEPGQTQQLSETVAPVNASNKNVTWASSNAGVASVSATGLVTANGDGNATITVTTVDGGFTATTSVTVSTVVVPVTGVSVSPTSITLDEGATQQLSVTISPANASNQSVTWSSNNTSVASVNASGLVTANNAGTATITVTTTDGGFTAVSNIIVEEIVIPTQSPYSGTPISLPGTVEVENFDHGGEGVAYHDTNTANDGGQYRTGEGVDIEACSDGGYNVGWTGAGEWLEYTVNVASAGTYDFEFRVASTMDAGTFHVEMNGSNVTGTVTSVNTGAWQTWTSVYANDVSLNAGEQIMRIALDNPNHNLDKVIITAAGSGTVNVTGVGVSPTSVSLGIGNTQQLTATISPANATNQNVTWGSNNSSIATVNGAGLVTAVSAGTATITVTSVDGGYTANSTVTVTGGGSASGYHIRNVWQNSYLTDGGGNVTYGASPSGDSYVWILEDVGGGNVEIKNASTGEYMHIENLTGSVQCTSRTFGWYSSRWAIEDAGSGESRIRNAWQSNNYIHVENLTGNAQHGTIYTAWASAKWVLESTGGARILVDNQDKMQSEFVNQEILIYPNPVINGELKIDLVSGLEKVQISVSDLSGKMILNNRFDGQEKVLISTDGWVKGLYLIRIESDSLHHTQKISIQ